jgi:uncharacterized protein (DUF2235 family)
MGRNIVVLSDGTGNSAAKLARTNVWRTYQALELGDGKQLAMYDDGVGTSAFKPLAIIGGAFGWGLKRNVLHLYKFLCRNYEEGDRIFGFGFSRGAFTIRVLTGLVLTQGLVRFHSEEELDYLAKCAYRAYRAERYSAKGSLTAVWRCLRRGWTLLRDWLYGANAYDKHKNRKIASIEFLGLWDTVDAYGMPVRELKVGIDKYLWPLTFDRVELHEGVRKACHALALDDERATFHPLVWDESREDPARKRLHQVWFAGVHSNVGGGYPDDSLSYVPLLWILEHARDGGRGLRFKTALLRQYRRMANPYGRIYDSRAGVSSYYRYAPRRVEDYPDPVIHESVYHRIAKGGDQYAPISLPAPYGEAAAEALVWDTVWWRRVAYWTLVAFTALLAFLAWKARPAPMLDQYLRDGVGLVMDVLVPFTPAFLEPWLGNLRESPALVSLCFVGIAAAFIWGRTLEARIRDRAARIWRTRQVEKRRRWARQSQRRWQAWASVLLALAAVSALVAITYGAEPRRLVPAVLFVVLGLFCGWRNRRIERQLKAGGSPSEPRGPSLAFANWLRNSRRAVRAWRALADRIIPFGFALLLLYLGAHAVNRLSFMALNIAGKVCESAARAVPLGLNEQRELSLDTAAGCNPTGVLVERGATYQVQLRMNENPQWRDGGVPVTSLAGFSSSDDAAPWYMFVAVPMRRYMSAHWFKPIALVGEHSLSTHLLAGTADLRDSTRTGELFLFVNDAVIGAPWIWDYFYRNNEGTATMVIRKTREAGEGI